MPKDNYHLSITTPGNMFPHMIEVWGDSAGEVEEMIEALGCHIISIHRPGSRFMWEFDRQELEHVTDVLKIKWPLKVTRGNSRNHTGRHSLKVKTDYDVPRHFIVVTKSLGIKRANQVTWHELAHAAQSERAADNAPANLSATGRAECWKHHPSRKGGYAARVCEDEATSYEICADHWMLLKEAQ